MTNTTAKSVSNLPADDEMYRALCDRNQQYEGVFFVGVRTTGVFCRPTCPARKPNRENVDFYGSTRDALSAGFRPCKKCRPLEVPGTNPEWLRRLISQLESDSNRRWTDTDLRQLDIEPARVRRWFSLHHGITFHGYLRSRRLAQAMGQIQIGKQATQAAMDSGFESLSGFNAAFRKWSGITPARSKSYGSPIAVNRVLTPLGPMVAAVVDDKLCLLEFADRRMLESQFKRLSSIFKRPFANLDHRLIQQTGEQLDEYFAGQRQVFELPVALDGSEFQRAVWNDLLSIPYGKTTSYERLAQRIGKPGAQRAVGRANGHNRLAIVVPCHRVIRSNGELSGYGGQVWRKKWLLDHEQKELV